MSECVCGWVVRGGEYMCACMQTCMQAVCVGTAFAAAPPIHHVVYCCLCPMPLLARWQDNDDGDDNDVDDNDGRGADPVPRVVRNVQRAV